MKTPRSSSLALATARMALVSTSPRFVDAALHVAPARAVRDVEAVLAALAEDRLLLLGERPALLLLQLGDGVVGLALPLVAEALVEHQRQDVVLVVLPRGLAAQDVGGAPEVGFELLEGEPPGNSVRLRAVAPSLEIEVRGGVGVLLCSAPPGPPTVPCHETTLRSRSRLTALPRSFPHQDSLAHLTGGISRLTAQAWFRAVLDSPAVNHAAGTNPQVSTQRERRESTVPTLGDRGALG